MTRGLTVVLSGPAGSGKDAVLREYFLAGGKAAKTVSVTTRAPREGETDGVDYRFVSESEFRRMAAQGELLEYTEYAGSLYGTPRADVEKANLEGRDVILKIDVAGGLSVKRLIPGAVLVFLLPPSARTLVSRLTGRGTENSAQLGARLEAALNEISAARENYGYIIVNDRLEDAARRFASILEAERSSTARNLGFLSGFRTDLRESERK